MMRAHPGVGWPALLAACAVGAVPALAQAPPAQNQELFPESFRPADPAELWAPLGPQAASTRHPAEPMLLSLAIPGLGQRRLGQRRGWAYLALEAVGWAFWIERRSAGADARDQYRDLAWSTARLQLAPRVDGSFSYYETLTQWTRSGAFDVDPSASGVQPETDSDTFNGSIWARAVAIFLPGGASVPPSDPGYQSALAYYQERAYSDGFLWDWTDEEEARSEYARLIDRSDARFRHATNVLGAILANHVISAADAYLSARGLSTALVVRAVRGPTRSRVRWSATMRIPGVR